MNKITKALVKIFDEDQKLIRKFSAGLIARKEITKKTKSNKETLISILKIIDFPIIKYTNKKAYKASILITLHSGDIGFMEKFLDKLRKQNSKEIDKGDIGYLVDKINVLKGLSQVYGTQYIKNKKEIKFLPILDEKNLDKRRKELGMENWEEYEKKIIS